MIILGFGLAALIGISLGLIGGGGSILTVPVFVYVLGFAAKPAIAMSLPVVGMTSLVGAVSHWRAGNVELRTASYFGVIAMAGSYFGARVSSVIPGTIQLLVLSAVILAAAASMMRSIEPHQVPAETETRRVRMPLWRAIVVGLAIGVLTGAVGIGGGFLIVPALVLMGGVPMKQAIGTSLLVIAMNSAAGFAGHHGTVDIPWRFLVSFTAVSVAGILVGTYLTRYLSGADLKRGFSIFLLVVGGLMLYQNRPVFNAAESEAAVKVNPQTPR